MHYEWDEAKNRLNQRKHGFSFEWRHWFSKIGIASFGWIALTRRGNKGGRRLGLRD
jgi:uncharacterized DUF497 family protein